MSGDEARNAFSELCEHAVAVTIAQLKCLWYWFMICWILWRMILSMD